MSGLKTSTNLQKHKQITCSLAQIEECVVKNTPVFIVCKKTRSLRTQLDAFEQSPRALDGYLQQYVSSICTLYFAAKEKVISNNDWETAADTFADLIYVLAKIKGYKIVANELSSDVYLVPRLVKLVESSKNSQRHAESYFLLLWLSRLVLVPFPLSTVENGLDSRILDLALGYLAVHSTASKTQTIASVLLASLVTRPDCLTFFSKYTESVVVDWPGLAENAKLGHLMAINQLLKKANGGRNAALVPEVHQHVLIYEISRVKFGGCTHKFNTLNALYLLKVAAKISKFFIGQAQFDVVASLINTTTELMHYMGDLFDASLRECMAKNLAKTVAYLATKAVNYAGQIISYMISQLRITGIEANSGFNADLHINAADLSVPRFHTILLFLGFLALTKSLPEEFVPQVISIAHQTCFISQRRFSFVQTSQLRDASCFCLWAISRTLSGSQFIELKTKYPVPVPTVFLDLVKVSIFDEDFTMRRCGIAVLQEFIGRFGSDFLGDMLNTKNASQIGEFTIRFIEHFGASTVGNLELSHEIIHLLIKMGFPKHLFFAPLLEEILADSSSFDLQKLGSRHLALVFSSEIEQPLHFTISSEISMDSIPGMLISALRRGTFSALYALAELQFQDLVGGDKVAEINLIVENLNLRSHSSVAYLGESIMRWINSCLLNNSEQNINKFSALITTIQKLDATDSLVSEFDQFFRHSPALPMEQFTQICRQIRMGNKLLAASIMSSELDDHKIVEISALFNDKALDAEVRATIISKLESATVTAENFALIARDLVNLLDDYTISEQGDVGSKVRNACINMIERKPDLFINFKSAYQAKLLRVAGEAMDRLRLLAFRVLCSSQSEAKFNDSDCDYDNNNDYDSYFKQLFVYYTQKCAGSTELEDAFWGGIVHSAGASTGANTMINSAFRNVIQHLRNAESVEKTFQDLTRLLRVPSNMKVASLDQRSQKTLQATINLLVKIFDAGVKIPSCVNFDSLFVRAYNLHINTTSTTRIALVIRIFQHLATSEMASHPLKAKCKTRLCWLCCRHPIAQVRVLAADALFEVANEVDPTHEIISLLETTKWEKGKPPATTASQLESIFQTI